MALSTKLVPKLRYPLEMITDKTDYMLIQVIKYTPPGVGLQGADQFLASTSGARFEGRVENSDAKIRKTSKQNTLAYIQMPMPQAIGDNNKAGWSRGDLSSLAAAAGSLVQSLMSNPTQSMNPGQLLTEGLNTITQAARGLAGQAGGMVNLGGDLLTAFAINLIPGSNVGINDFLARQRGVVVNPNAEFLFRGPSLREFAFQYTFVPRDQQEANQIKEIIRTFKKHMAPKKNTQAFGGNNLFGGFLSTPDVFKLTYKSGTNDHRFLNKFKICALTGMEVNYTPMNSYASYDDGTPVAMTMVLRFGELTPIYAEDYDSEFAQGGVGF